MEEAIKQRMGGWDHISHLYDLYRSSKYLLQIYKIDNRVTTMDDFMRASGRAFIAGNNFIGPPVIDIWCGAFDTVREGRLLYGFCLMFKPDISIAELVHQAYKTDPEALLPAISKTTPFVKDLASRIYGKCELRNNFNPANVSVYTIGRMKQLFPDKYQPPKDYKSPSDMGIAVVSDWSFCYPVNPETSFRSFLLPFHTELNNMIETLSQ